MNLPSLAGTWNSAVWNATDWPAAEPLFTSAVDTNFSKDIPVLGDPIQGLHRDHLELVEEGAEVVGMGLHADQGGQGPRVLDIVAYCRCGTVVDRAEDSVEITHQECLQESDRAVGRPALAECISSAGASAGGSPPPRTERGTRTHTSSPVMPLPVADGKRPSVSCAPRWSVPLSCPYEMASWNVYQVPRISVSGLTARRSLLPGSSCRPLRCPPSWR